MDTTILEVPENRSPLSDTVVREMASASVEFSGDPPYTIFLRILKANVRTPNWG